MDNYYNSVQLCRYLKSRATDVVGTLNRRRNNRFYPSKKIFRHGIPGMNVVSILKEHQISRRDGNIFIEDDILFMEWGE